jgi:hypothetical protein
VVVVFVHVLTGKQESNHDQYAEYQVGFLHLTIDNDRPQKAHKEYIKHQNILVSDSPYWKDIGRGTLSV